MKNNKIIINDINKQNFIIQDKLNFKEISKINTKWIILKILDINFLKYRKEISEKVDYIEYLNFLYEKIEVLFLNTQEIKLENILEFHRNVFSIYSNEELKEIKIKNIWEIRNESRMIYNLDENGKLINRNYFVSVKKAKKQFIGSIEEYNISSKSIEDIAIFFQKSISKIHPFENWNWRVFFTILDLLLFKNNFLPLFINQNKKEYNQVLNKYYYDHNFKKLIINFLNFILKRYNNYQIK